MEKMLHTLLKNSASESRLIYKKGPEAPNAFQQMEKAKEGITLEEAKKQVDAAMKEIHDKEVAWRDAITAGTQSANFGTILDKAMTELNKDYQGLLDMFAVPGVDMKAEFEKKDLPTLREVGKNSEATLKTLTEQAEADRIELKKEQLKTEVAALDKTYEGIVDEATRVKDQYTAGTTIADQATLDKVKMLVEQNLWRGIANRGVNGLMEIKDGTLYKSLDKKGAKLKEADLDATLLLLTDTNTFPKTLADFCGTSDGVALDDQSIKFVAAVENLTSKFGRIPQGPEADKAKAEQQPKIDALLEQINKEEAYPADFISAQRQIETAIMIGYLKDKLPALKDTIDSVFQMYELGKWDNDVDPAKVKEVIDAIKADPVLSGTVNISLEGGADSVQFLLDAKKYDTEYFHYVKAAQRLLAIPELLADPRVDQGAIEEIAKLQGKPDFEKYLERHATDIAYLKSANGPFNTILAYMRLEDVAGEGLVNVPDRKKVSLYTEMDAEGDAYRYSLVLGYKSDKEIAEEEAARKEAEEEAARKKAEEEAARQKAEEEAARQKAEEEAKRKEAVEAAKKVGKTVGGFIDDPFGIKRRAAEKKAKEAPMGGPSATKPEASMGGPSAKAPEKQPVSPEVLAQARASAKQNALTELELNGEEALRNGKDLYGVALNGISLDPAILEVLDKAEVEVIAREAVEQYRQEKGV